MVAGAGEQKSMHQISNRRSQIAQNRRRDSVTGSNCLENINFQYGVQDLGLVTIFKGSSAEQVCLCCSGAQRARGYAAIFLIIIILFFPASTTMLAALVAPSSLRSLRMLGLAPLAFLGCSLR